MPVSRKRFISIFNKVFFCVKSLKRMNSEGCEEIVPFDYFKIHEKNCIFNPINSKQRLDKQLFEQNQRISKLLQAKARVNIFIFDTVNALIKEHVCLNACAKFLLLWIHKKAFAYNRAAVIYTISYNGVQI